MNLTSLGYHIPTVRLGTLCLEGGRSLQQAACARVLSSYRIRAPLQYPIAAGWRLRLFISVMIFI